MNQSPLSEGVTKMWCWVHNFQIVFGGAHILAAVFIILYWSIQPLDDIEGRMTGAVVSLILTAAGCTIVFGIPDGYVTLNVFTPRARAFPEEPWKWRDDWACGMIKNRGRFLRFVPWFAGGYVLFLTFPSLLFRGTAVFQEPPEAVAMLLMGPSLGLICLIPGLYSAARWRRYGGSTLELVTNPGVTGGWLRVILHSKLRLDGAGRLLATLQCTYSDSSGGKTKSRKIWRQSRFVDAGNVVFDGAEHSRIPIAFYIPYDCVSDIRCKWELEVSARVSGPNYHATFLVPVFKTDKSTPEVPEEAVGLQGCEIPVSKKYYQNSRARVTPLSGGGLEVKTRTLRPIPFVIMALAFAVYSCWMVFGAISSGRMSYLSYVLMLPFLLPLVVLSICGAMWWGLGRHLATFDTHSATIRRSALFLGVTHVIPLTKVSGICHGPAYFSHGKPREDVTLVAGDRTYTLASGLPVGEGRWLASVITSYLEESAEITFPREIDDTPRMR